MKQTFIAAVLLCFAVAASAQVYRYTPRYVCPIIYIHGKTSVKSFDRIDSCTSGTYIIDLDKKYISDPRYYGDSTPITSITREYGKITMKVKRTKGIEDSHQFVLRLNNADSIIYLQDVETWAGSSRDTSFTTYTNFPFTLSFLEPCWYAKKTGSTYSGDLDRFYNSETPFADNTFEMFEGYVTWTEGKGNNAIIHHLYIDDAKAIKDKYDDGIAIYCHENDTERYELYYMTTDRIYTKGQYGKKRFILLKKFTGETEDTIGVYYR
ncbi:MAG: hypothetical protein WDM90_06560 [Ferruginibacter sp.]